MSHYRALVAAVRDGQWITRDRIIGYPRAFGAVFIAGLLWLVFSPVGQPWNGSDFAGFWVPADLAASGHATAIYDQPLFAAHQQTVSGQSDMYLPWVYPPTFLLLILSLGVLPYKVAFVVWIAVGLAVYLAALRKVAGRDGLVLALTFPGIMVCIYNGHAEFMLAGFFGGAMLLLDRRPYIAGLLIGLCSVKPHLFMLVPVALVTGGCWRTILTAAMTTLLGATLSVAVLGPEIWHDFFLTVSGIGGGVVQHGQAFATIWAKQQSAFAYGFRFLGAIPAVAFQLAAVTLGAWAVIRTWAETDSLPDRSVVLCLATLLASPYLFDYDLVLLALPIALLVRNGLAKGFRPWEQSLISLIWVAPLLVRSFSYFGDLPATVILLGSAVGYFITSSSREAACDPSYRLTGFGRAPSAGR